VVDGKFHKYFQRECSLRLMNHSPWVL
jgi:hypothetical protein